MKSLRNTQGFHVIEGVLIVAVIALIGFVGYRFWDATQNTKSKPSQTSAQEVAPVNSAEDLNTVDNQLDAVDVEGTYESDLDGAGTF